MIKKSTVDLFLNENKNLILLNEKRPVTKNWLKDFPSKETLYNHSGNLGWVLGEEDFVIDIDPRNKGDQSYLKLQDYLKIFQKEHILSPSVATPRGGIHIYLKLPETYIGKRLKSNLEQEYPGIDFLKKGNHCVIPNSQIKGIEYKWYDGIIPKRLVQKEAPEELLELLEIKEKKTDNKKHQPWELIKIKNFLDEHFDPTTEYHQWLRIGMAIHNDHPNNKGFAIWNNWSKKSHMYDEKEIIKKWESFNSNREESVSMGTLVYYKETKTSEERDKIFKLYEQKIRFSDLKQLEQVIIPHLKNSEIEPIIIERLVPIIRSRFIECNRRTSSLQIRNLLATKIETEKPAWTFEWLYINHLSKYFNLKTRKISTTEGFNVQNGHKIELPYKGRSKMSASKYTMDKGYIRCVENAIYYPILPDLFFDVAGIEYVNLFNPNSFIKPADQYTANGKKAISLLKYHLNTLWGSEEYGTIILEWLACQIQRPGVKIPWVPLIQSIQGAGKSFIRDLLKVLIGNENVGVVGPQVITTQFNGWANKHCVIFLEELSIKGHNRHDSMNALKPLITDDYIQINEKQVPAYQAFNVTNYFCCTNFKDSLALDTDDRRWFIVYSPIEKLTDFAKDKNSYFNNLMKVKDIYQAEVMKFLTEYPISDEFLQMKIAPMTDSKESMIATEDSTVDFYEEAVEVLEEGGQYYNSEVLSTKEFFEAILAKNPDFGRKSNREKTLILKKLKFTKFPKKIRIGDEIKNIWTKKHISKQKIQEILEITNEIYKEKLKKIK